MRARYQVGWLAALVLLALVISAGKLPVSWMLPSGNVKFKASVYQKGAPKFCALTFDDGPNNTYMPKIQRILDEQGVKATFFCVGQLVPARAKELKALVASGHELGNHSYTHPMLQHLSSAQQQSQIARCQQALTKLGLSATWFRPPYGAFNRNTVHAASASGLETVLWSVDPRDWSKPGAERIRNRVLRGVGNGAIVLLHCTNAQTVEALPGIIQHLRDKGYHFLTMSEWRIAAGTGALPKAAAPKAAPVKPATASQVAAEKLGLQLLAPQPDAPGGKSASAAATMQPTFYRTFGSQDNAASTDSSVDPRASAMDELPGDSVTQGAGVATLVLDEGEAAPAPAPAASAPAASQPAATKAADLLVRANFLDLDGVWSIWRSGRGGKLQLCTALLLPLIGVGPSGEVVDTALTPGPDLPVEPGSGWFAPPSTGETVAPAAAGDATASLPPLEQRKPLDFRIVDLVDFKNPLTQWQPPASIDPAAFDEYPVQKVSGSLLPGAQFYFLSLAPDIDDYTWTELETTVRLGRLSGLVLASDFVSQGPQCALPYPWAWHCFAGLDRAAMIDLTVENATAVMEAIAKGKPHLFIVVRPDNLNFFISAHTLAKMGRNLRDFILLRQATAGLPYDPAPALAEYWKLPASISIGRFTDGKRVALVLYSHDLLAHEVAVPKEFAYFSQVTVDAGGWLRVASLADPSVVVDASPVVLYYEYPQ